MHEHKGLLVFPKIMIPKSLEKNNAFFIGKRSIKNSQYDEKAILVFKTEDTWTVYFFKAADRKIFRIDIMIPDNIEHRERESVFISAFGSEIPMFGFGAAI